VREVRSHRLLVLDAIEDDRQLGPQAVEFAGLRRTHDLAGVVARAARGVVFETVDDVGDVRLSATAVDEQEGGRELIP
jgi:hypothetical protein